MTMRTRGKAISDAKSAMVMIHGRGATAEGILELADVFDTTDFAYLAPQAEGHTWYPQSFLAPIPDNEPKLSQGLATIGDAVQYIIAAGIPQERIMLLGFSQGACLALEYTARNAGRYGGVVAFSGGLIGPEGTPRDYAGTFAETPIFIGCSDVDFHVPLWRVQESTQVLQGLGADVTERIYPGMGHTINQDEIDFVNAMMRSIA